MVESLSALRAHVFASPALQDVLQKISDREQFVAAVFEVAQALKLPLDQEALQLAMRDSHYNWLASGL